MEPIAEEGGQAKSQRRGGAKSVAPIRKPPRMNDVRIGDKEFETLCIYAIKTKRPKAEIVEELIRKNLKRFVVQDRGGPVAVNLAEEARDPVESMPISEFVTPSEAENEAPTVGAGEGAGEATPLPRRKRA